MEELAARLLREFRVPSRHLTEHARNQLADLKTVLLTDYVERIRLPARPLLGNLRWVLENAIVPLAERMKGLRTGESMVRFLQIFGPRGILWTGRPYREGAGLELFGFCSRAIAGSRNHHIIFVNTAHHPGAVAVTLGHEVGHYLYETWSGNSARTPEHAHATLTAHLEEEGELFADSLVALAAYSHEVIHQIGPLGHVDPADIHEAFRRIRRAYDLIAPPFDLDRVKGRIAVDYRIWYLTARVHLFKLRCALLERANL